MQISNQIGFPYSNLELSIAVSNHLQVANVTESTKTLKVVSPHEKVGIPSFNLNRDALDMLELEFALEANGFNCNTAVVYLSFTNPEAPFSEVQPEKGLLFCCKAY